MDTPFLHRDAAAAMGPSMDADACLALRPASVECGLCRDACPRSAIEWAEADIRVSDACVDCGRCAAVCPSAALVFKAAGMHHVALDPTAGPLTLRVECQRVPPQSRQPGSQVLPCLGAATALQMLEWMAAGRVPVLMDRGWCADCPAGGAHAVTTFEVVADARHDAAIALGVRSDAVDAGLPSIENAPLPSARALPPPQAARATGAAMGRRSFFATLRGGARSVAAAVARPRWTRTRAACRPSVTLSAERARRSAVLAALAARAGHALSAAAFPSLSAHANCCHEGVCAAACPSGALSLVDNDDHHAGLDFNAAACIGCGLCEQLCPHGALSLAQAGPADAAAPVMPVALTRHPLRRCTRCDDEFVAREDTALCPRCVMAREQSHNLFGALLTGSAGRNASTPLDDPRR